MPLPSKPHGELNGWKEISEYLRVSVRTAQAFEQDAALPIHRMPGARGRVWTTAEDLDAWRQARRTGRPGDSQAPLEHKTAPPPIAPPAAEPVPPALPPAPIGRRSVLRYGAFAGAAAALAGAGIGLGVLRRRAHRPVAGLRIQDATVTAVAADGAGLWSHTFNERLMDTTSSKFRTPSLIADLDGDGRKEVLFQRIFEADPWPILLCFDAAGNLRWEFVPGKTVTDNFGRTFAPPFGIHEFHVLHSPASPIARVVVTSNHHMSFPCQAAVLDAKTGQLLGEYWHRGHLRALALADLDGDREPEILLAGVNDAREHDQATLLVFDHRNVHGASCDPKGEPYFHGMSPGTEKKVVFFPRTLASADQEFNLAYGMTPTAERLQVSVAEGTSAEDPSVVYEFDHSLRVTNVVFTGRLVHRYRELQEAGKMPSGKLDLQAMGKALADSVTVASPTPQLARGAGPRPARW